MATQERIICRLCLKVCDNFKAIEGDMKDMLDTLLPKIDLIAIQKPVMCTSCVEMLIECVNFQMTCFDAHDSIVSFIDDKDVVKVDLLDVYLSKNGNCPAVLENQNICGFCMSPRYNCSDISLDGEVGDFMLRNMIEKCLPELDMSLIMKPVICVPCHSSLKKCFSFVKNCLILEEKIKNYCEIRKINSEAQIGLNHLLEFTSRADATSEVDGNSAGIIKVEEQLYESGENSTNGEIDNVCDVFKLEPVFCDVSEDVKEEDKHKNKSGMDLDDLDFNDEQLALQNRLAYKVEIDKDVIKLEEIFCEETGFKRENIAEEEDHKFLVNEEVEVKSDEPDFIRFDEGVVLPQSEVTTKSNPEVDRSKASIKQAATTYECESCSFQTKYKRTLNNHLLIHKDPSEVTTYKCDSCSYGTIYKDQLKIHSLQHKYPSEVTMYKCDVCPYQTKYSRCIKTHLLVHKDPSEVTMYKCDTCSFETKYKYQLKGHSLSHSQVKAYKCNSCSFQTKSKHYLKRHFLKHKDPSEVTAYKCDSCEFKTKYKRHLKKHFLVHSQVKMYKCDSCSFRTKCKTYLKAHVLLQHKDSSEVTLYKCDSCSFQTKYKYSLKKHSVKHKNPSVVTMHKCDSCSFQTKYSDSLKRHELTYKHSQK